MTDDAPLSYGMTRAEVAERLGITRARVGQLEKSALKKIRRALEREPLRGRVERAIERAAAPSPVRVKKQLKRCNLRLVIEEMRRQRRVQLERDERRP